MINGEEIITTVDHPFYVNDRGFVNAGELAVGDELLDSNKNILLVENFDVELTDEPTTVYNFQVEYNVPLVKTQMKKIIVTAKTLYSHPKNVSKIYAALHTDLAW